MSGQRLGSLIGAVFGLVYVVVNSAPLPAGARLPLQVLAVVAFAAVLITVLRSRSGTGAAPPRRVFGRAYWLVVAVMVIALIVGARLLSGPLGMPEAGVAWASFVVGVHFFALAAVFGQRFFHALGAAVTACGLAGFALVATGADAAPIAVVSGVVPGAVLLGTAWWGARRAGRPMGRPASA